MWPRQDFNYYIIDKWTIIALDPNVFQNSTLESKIKGFVYSILKKKKNVILNVNYGKNGADRMSCGRNFKRQWSFQTGIKFDYHHKDQ